MSTEQPSGIQDVATRLREMIGAHKVFGEPIEQNGMIVIPVARVSGGGGGGSGTEPGKGQGFGGGLGWGSRATGVYVLRGDEVCWKPAVDVNRAIVAGAIVLVTLLVTVRTGLTLRARQKQR